MAKKTAIREVNKNDKVLPCECHPTHFEGMHGGSNGECLSQLNDSFGLFSGKTCSCKSYRSVKEEKLATA